MGAYINPPGETKEQFLEREATCEISRASAVQHDDFEKNLLVVLKDNGSFSAAGIAFDPWEKEIFTAPSVYPLKFYVVPKEKLLPVSNLDVYLSRS